MLLLRAAALASAASGVITFVIDPLRGRFRGDFEDYRAYLDAARAVTSHGDVYARFLHQTPNVALTGFDYPPIVAWLVQPLAWMPPGVASTLWLWLLVVASAVAVGVIVRELLPSSWPRLEIATLLTFAYAAGTYNYWHGNMNAVIFLLMALALRSWMRGQQVRCGVFLGVAASIKLAPLVLVILLLRCRWWRGAVSMVATVAAAFMSGVVLVGMPATREWLTGVLPVLTRQDGWIYNQSLSGTMSRLFAHGVLVPESNSTALSLLDAALSLGALGLLAWVATPLVRERALRGAQFGAGVLVMLLAGSLAWYAHFVSALIAVCAAAGLVAYRRPHHARAVLWACSAFLLINAVVVPAWLALIGSWTQVVPLSHTPWWYVLTQLASLPALTSVALLIALVVEVRSSLVGGDPHPVRARRQHPVVLLHGPRDGEHTGAPLTRDVLHHLQLPVRR
jgi:Glycosyltransferase family 87